MVTETGRDKRTIYFATTTWGILETLAETPGHPAVSAYKPAGNIRQGSVSAAAEMIILDYARVKAELERARQEINRMQSELAKVGRLKLAAGVKRQELSRLMAEVTSLLATVEHMGE